jgi:hypothetical protein
MILTTLWKQFSLNSDLIHKLSLHSPYIQKVARFITGDTIVSVIISTRQDENCDEAAQMKWFSGTLGIFLSSWLTLLKDVFCCRTGLRNLEGPFYESHYFYESKNTDAKFKHFRSRMSVEMILSTKYYK